MSISAETLSVFIKLSSLEAVATGSRVFRVEQTTSDYDFVTYGDNYIRIRNYLDNSPYAVEESSYFEGSFKVILTSDIVPIILNIIRCKDEKDFNQWVSTTDLVRHLCQEVPSFKTLVSDKRRRIEIFKSIRSYFTPLK